MTYMQKYFLYTICTGLAAMSLLLYSCNKKDGTPPAPTGGSLTNLTAHPDSALPGTLVNVKGSGLQGVVSVQFGTVSATINPSYNTESDLLIFVPNNAGYGQQSITLTNGLGTTAQINFRVIQPAPTITSVNPLSAKVGDTVTVTGTFYRNIISVMLGSQVAQVIDSTSANILRFKVPAGVVAGLVTVKTAGGTAVSTATITTEQALIIADFDGAGIRTDGNSWYSYGDMTSKAVASSNPAPIQGNFLKAIPQTTNTAGYAGVSTYTATSGSQTFGLTSAVAATNIKFDANSNGYNTTQVQVIVEDESAQNYNRVVSINWNGWQTVVINCADLYVGYGTTAQTPATALVPSKIKTIKFHFINYAGNASEVNLDNIRFTY
jgi:hypothetical protein